jgi:2-haloacid dehalogenase
VLARPEIILFDVYGTLFDVEGHDWAEPDVVETMRAKQLQYTWLLTLMERYVDFRDVTRRAIAYAADVHGVDGLDLSAALEAQAHVPPFPEVADALERLGHGARLGVLSNGDPESL